MKTAIRRPKIRKPSKGMKNFFKQQKNGIVRALRNITDPNKKKQWWHKPKQVRALWLRGFNTSHYRPHQSAQEKARRVRQMACGFIRP